VNIALVYGGRDYDDPGAVQTAISCLQPDEIVSGCARGADQMGEAAAYTSDIAITRFPADWSKGKHAGFARNAAMVDYLVWRRETGHTVYGIVFPGGNGTAHTTSLLIANGIMVIDGEEIWKESVQSYEEELRMMRSDDE
jgi:hypothetical protein